MFITYVLEQNLDGENPKLQSSNIQSNQGDGGGGIVVVNGNYPILIISRISSPTWRYSTGCVGVIGANMFSNYKINI